jgi:hypothetical protein
MAPDHIDLVYRRVGENHIFASKGIKGLVHVGHSDLEAARTNLLKALSTHVQKTYGVEARYDLEFEGLKKKISSRGERLMVQAVLDQVAA